MKDATSVFCLTVSAAISFFGVWCFSSVWWYRVGLSVACLSWMCGVPVTTDNFLCVGPIMGTGASFQSNLEVFSVLFQCLCIKECTLHKLTCFGKYITKIICLKCHIKWPEMLKLLKSALKCLVWILWSLMQKCLHLYTPSETNCDIIAFSHSQGTFSSMVMTVMFGLGTLVWPAGI